MTPWLSIIGINEDAHLAPDAIALLQRATLTIGGRRHLALAAPHISGDSLPWPSPMTDAVPAILARRPQPTAILASGDPLWFGVASLVLRHAPIAETRIIPAASAFAQAAARLGWALQDTDCLSCCGRPVESILPHLHPGARLLVLSAGADTPPAIAALLAAHGWAASRLTLLEALGGLDERIHHALPATIHPLNLLAIEADGPARLLSAGLDDALFEHDGQITKSDVRALTLAALAPRHGELLWDLGAGAGSIGIEWLRHHPSLRAVAVERDPARAARIRRNAHALGAPQLDVIEADAETALATLPPPDAIFLGAAIPALLAPAWPALKLGGRLVANAVTLPAEHALTAAQARHGGTLLRIALERLGSIGPNPAYRPALTVTQWRAVK